MQAMEKRKEIYKIEMLNELPADENISFFQQGDIAKSDPSITVV